ncbi:hypothetical protein HY58_08930 [Flavihumibacter sp. ZG627]|nr:hypothetical protein HY58_08930 [Flavihumibacter sp. ZG627]
MPSGLGGGDNRIKFASAKLTTPWRFDSSSYSNRVPFLFLILWGDEIFGRHALSSRGWGFQDKLSIEPTGIAVPGNRYCNKADQG